MRFVLFFVLLGVYFNASAYLWMGPNGVIYGNVCMIQLRAVDGFGRIQTQVVSQELPQPQPVGTNCFATRYGVWGYIANF